MKSKSWTKEHHEGTCCRVANGPSKVVGVAKFSLNLTGFIQFGFFFGDCVSRIFFFTMLS